MTGSSGAPPGAPGGFRELRELLDRFGVTPRRSRGQNFLHDPALLQSIVADASVGPGDLVLEIGGGSGFLTRELRRAGADVVIAEIDERLVRCLEWQFGEDPGVRIVAGDALAGKRHLSPGLLASLSERTGPVRLVANLPYSIGITAVLAWLRSGLPLGAGMVMVQREVAARMVAPPGTKDYGPATVALQLRAELRTRRDVAPQAFHPRPKVDSTTVEVVPLERLREDVGDEDAFERLVRGAFQQRRKRIANSVGSIPFVSDRPIAEVRERIAGAGVDPTRRTDSLSISEFAALSRALLGVLPPEGTEFG